MAYDPEAIAYPIFALDYILHTAFAALRSRWAARSISGELRM
jgi:hypothetical protein